VIASVRGRVLSRTLESAVIEVGGIGLAVQCTPDTLAGLTEGAEATLRTALVVREDSLTLFGFADDDEKAVFEILQTATGIGPRLAQAALAVLRPDALRRAVAGDDLATLIRVPGIGRKGAQRLVVELKDRLGPPRDGSAGTSPAPRPARTGPTWHAPVEAGLLNLGWPARDVARVLGDLAADPQTPTGVPEVLRAALRELDRG
jgi:Holliday junction DNA helicase RuvA